MVLLTQVAPLLSSKALSPDALGKVSLPSTRMRTLHQLDAAQLDSPVKRVISRAPVDGTLTVTWPPGRSTKLAEVVSVELLPVATTTFLIAPAWPPLSV